MVILYGIKNCDTMKKARTWLDQHKVEYRFHDVRVDGLEEKTLQQWTRSVGWETLLNTRGTTWRQLSDKDKSNITETKAIKLMLQHPAMIKRPVLVQNKMVHVGFKEQEYQQLFAVS